MTRVVAQGTFDILHPGHLHYLTEAAAMGDELHVIIARSENITHKAEPIIGDRQRRDMVAALDPVDDARLGDTDDFLVPIRAIDPDIVVLGYDQYHDEDAVTAMLDDGGIDCEVARASARDPKYDNEILSTGGIVDRICNHRC